VIKQSIHPSYLPPHPTHPPDLLFNQRINAHMVSLSKEHAHSVDALLIHDKTGLVVF